MQIIWKSSFLDSIGYSAAARGYVIGLYKLGVDVRCENLESDLPRVDLPEDQELIIRNCLANPVGKRFIVVRHYAADKFRPRKKAFASIGMCAWESNRIHPAWVEGANQMDAVWLPSWHNIEAFQASGVTTPLEYVRHGVGYADLEGSTLNFANDGMPDFKFLSIFQWNYRKGYDALLKAFWQEFSNRDDVGLVIKTYGMGGSAQEWKAILNEIIELKESWGFAHKPTAPVYVYTKVMPARQIQALYQLTDCFVLPSRGEGVGLPFLEAAEYGCPIIATGWGGQTDFLAEDNSYLIRYKLAPPQKMAERTIRHWDHHHLWAEPDVEHLAALMRYVYSNREEAKNRGLKLKQLVSQNFTWQESAMDVVKAVEKLTGESLV